MAEGQTLQKFPANFARKHVFKSVGEVELFEKAITIQTASNFATTLRGKGFGSVGEMDAEGLQQLSNPRLDKETPLPTHFHGKIPKRRYVNLRSNLRNLIKGVHLFEKNDNITEEQREIAMTKMEELVDQFKELLLLTTHQVDQ